jgi:hypothetical protein
MKAVVDPPNHEFEFPASLEGDTKKVEAVLQELDRILASRYFRSAGRSRQFLQYVVQHKLDGHVEQLKERTIGTEVFQRSPGYATGDDPVVRVQAGEVRRRLEQYYQTASGDSLITIRLPVGSYSPTFEWPASAVSAVVLPTPISAPAPVLPQTKLRIRPWILATVCVALVLAAGLLFVTLQHPARKQTTMDEFWSPVFATQQPVIICLAKPVVYLPSAGLYERYARTHPGTFETEVERYNHPLPLDPKEKLVWGDMGINREFGVAVGDTYAGVSLSGLLGKIGKPSQLRIGSNYSFEDLRDSPAVIVGAFNNRWTMQFMANLHYIFVEKDGKFMIQEQGPGGRVWQPDVTNAKEQKSDFAIVARLLDSQTGQFAITVAGVTGTGTQAAAEFVSNSAYLEKGLGSAPAGWQKKNMELVLQTTITDSTPGPPHVVAAYYW